MDSIFIFFTTVTGVIVVMCLIFYWAMKKRKATLRLIAVLISILNLRLCGFLMYATQDRVIFIATVGASISQSVFILSILRIAPTQFKILEKNLGIKW